LDATSCDPLLTELNTGCVGGDICVAEATGYVCRKACDANASTADCPAGFTCHHDTHACQR
jgi:hypothetical protein